MLLVATGHGVQDLDTGDTFVDGEPVTALASSLAGCCALLDRRHVVRLDPAGPVPVGSLPEPDGQSLAVLADGTVVLGRAGARLAVMSADGNVVDVPAFGSVPGRDDWENPANPTPDTRTMAAGPRRWWVNVHVGGVWWSDDTGRTWHGAIEPEADVHEVRTGADGSVAVAAAVGFGWSTDDGNSWSWTTDGLHASYLRAAALDGRSTFASASDGPFTKNGAVYRARVGSSFVRCETGLPSRFDGNVDSSNLDAAGGRAAIGFRDSVYLSEDAGVTWRVAATLPGPVRAVRFGPA
jgi:hypothetical protein